MGGTRSGRVAAATEAGATERDRPFDPFRSPRSCRAKAMVSEAIGRTIAFEEAHRPRKRKRRAVDQATFEQTVTALVCDLAHRELTKPAGKVAVPFSHQALGRSGRYQPPALSKTLPNVARLLAAPAEPLATLTTGQRNPFGEGRRTTMQAGPALLRLMQDHGITLADLGRAPGDEAVILKRAKEDAAETLANGAKGERADYLDTEETKAFRTQMQEINAWLAEAEIDLACPIFDMHGTAVDPTKRYLRRHFTNSSFQCGGRLFGGFWQEMPKAIRNTALVIEGEEVATLDYGQMGPRILYGLTTGEEPHGDAYALPGLEHHRAGVKKVFGASLFATHRLSRFPRETRDLFPVRASMTEVLDKMLALHAPVRRHFFTGIGHRLQFAESQIMVGLLLALKAEGIVGLPIHDAVIVPLSSVPLVTTIMKDIFRSHTGVDALVSLEGGHQEQSPRTYLRDNPGCPYEGPVRTSARHRPG